MILKCLLMGIIFLTAIYGEITNKIKWKQYEKPLPAEVSDIYDAKRYEEFIQYRKDYLRPKAIVKWIGMFINAFLIFGPFYHWMEEIAGSNV